MFLLEGWRSKREREKKKQPADKQRSLFKVFLDNELNACGPTSLPFSSRTLGTSNETAGPRV